MTAVAFSDMSTICHTAAILWDYNIGMGEPKNTNALIHMV